MRWFYKLLGINKWKGRRAVPGILAEIRQSGNPAVPEQLTIPAYLITLKNAYENGMTDVANRYMGKTRRMSISLDKACVKGDEAIHQMETGLFDHLVAVLKARRRRWLTSLGFLALGLVLVVLDFGPTKLVVDSVFQHEIVNPMFCRGSECLIDRDVLLTMTILLVMASVVIMGHVAASYSGSEYLDASRSSLGWLLLIVVVLLSTVLSTVRFVHETGIVEQKLEFARGELREQLDEAGMTGDTTRKSAIARQLQELSSESGSEAWRRGHMLRVVSSAGLFTVLSVILFLAAFFASLYHKYPDLEHIRRRRRMIQARKESARALTDLDNAFSRRNHDLEELRQSAQREVGEFCEGVEQAAKGLKLDDQSHAILRQALRKIQQLFNTNLSMPRSLIPGESKNPDQAPVHYPRKDRGEAYRGFYRNLVLYDALEIGGIDALNGVIANPDGMVLRMVLASSEADVASNAIITSEETKKWYNTGHAKGQQARAEVFGTVVEAQT